MADSIKASFEHGGWDGLFDMLETTGKESLARRMGVAGGRVIRDAAAVNASEIPPKAEYGAPRRGVLAKAMYVAYDKRNTNRHEYSYNVSWNSRIARHGHLVEFGHWQIYKIFLAKDGHWYTNKKQKLDVPKWQPGYPFLRPAFDNNLQRALTVMIEAGRDALPEIMKGNVE